MDDTRSILTALAESAERPAALRRGSGRIGLAIAGLLMGSTLVTPLYRLYRLELVFSELTLTLIYAVYVLGNVASLLLLGRLSDQIGRRRVPLPALGLACGATLLFLVAGGVAWLFAAQFVSGFAVGLAIGCATAWLTELEGQARKGRAALLLLPGLAAMVLAQSAQSLPLLLGGTVISSIAAGLGYRGSLAEANAMAPDDQRAALVSSYFLACFLGNSLPVIGASALATATGSLETASAIFAVIIALLALAALLLGSYQSSRPSSRSRE